MKSMSLASAIVALTVVAPALHGAIKVEHKAAGGGGVFTDVSGAAWVSIDGSNNVVLNAAPEGTYRQVAPNPTRNVGFTV